MTNEQESIDAEFKRSELRWRSDIECDVKELVRLERARSDKYDKFIDMLIEREGERKELRKAIMHKTLSGLMWIGVLGLFSLMASGSKVELFKLLDAWRGTK